eukprot:gb/GECG01002750.1/.p1 GENE.gb/GECG01002750.1/~~gb/GECG01002750.1/.p1  ORF type:complete len:505 (+),score=31.13 gb/GECG01002750.1/:1-1515(+)
MGDSPTISITSFQYENDAGHSLINGSPDCRTRSSLGSSPKYNRLDSINGEEDEVDSAEKGASFSQSTFNAINVLVGIGMLSYPVALKSSGWIGVGIMLLFALITRYTALILGRSMDVFPECRSFSDLGKKAFGEVGRVLITVVFFLELMLAACASYLIVFATNLESMFESKPMWFFALIGALTVLPTTWIKDMSRMSYLSILGILSSISLIFIIIYTGVAHPNGESFVHGGTTKIVVPKSIPFSIGVFMIGFGGHAVFPVIYDSMKNKKEYPKVLNWTYTVTMLCYGAVAVGGYLLYGEDTDSEITLNLPAGPVTDTCKIVIVLNAVCKFAISLSPVGQVSEDMIQGILGIIRKRRVEREMLQGKRIPNVDSSDSLLDQVEKRIAGENWEVDDSTESESGRQETNAWSEETKIYLRGVLTRTLLTGVVLLIAIYLPYFSRIMAFSGALLSFSVSVIFPPLAYIRLMKLANIEISATSLCWNWALGIFGIVCALVGTVAAFVGKF